MLVESSLLWSWNELEEISISGNQAVKVVPDEQMRHSRALSAVCDIQLSQLPLNRLKELTHPFEVFRFGWADKNLSDRPESNVITVRTIQDGKAQVSFH